MRATRSQTFERFEHRNGVLAEVLLHPISLVCTLVWALNDHSWKWKYGNWLTGKLSDVGSLVVFPLLVFSLLQLAAWAVNRDPNPSRRTLLWVLGVVGACFAAINVWDTADFVYRCIVGLLRIPEALLAAPLEAADRVQHTSDAGDLLTLPALWIAYRIALPYTRDPTGQPDKTATTARSADSSANSSAGQQLSG